MDHEGITWYVTVIVPLSWCSIVYLIEVNSIKVTENGKLLRTIYGKDTLRHLCWLIFNIPALLQKKPTSVAVHERS